MPINSETHISIFADDTAILRVHENTQEALKNGSNNGKLMQMNKNASTFLSHCGGSLGPDYEKWPSHISANGSKTGRN